MNITEIVAEYGSSPSDTGSTTVQCALLTEKINNLTIHLKKNKHDFQTKRSLKNMVVHRSKLLSYLKRSDNEKYKNLLKNLNINH